jgi:hypothetical protein
LAASVLDKRKKPLMPSGGRRAPLLLERGRAVILRRYPFTIRIKDRVGGAVQPVRIKIDPGSKYAGIGVTREEDGNKGTVLGLGELAHRGRQISEALTAQRVFRRNANLPYRAPRFLKRCRPKREGRLPPSLQHRVDTCMSRVERLRRPAPVTGLAVERVCFDKQLLENPEVAGVEYQQRTLAGYAAREYVFEKLGRYCVYCGVTDVPLNLDDTIPKTRGGSNRVSNVVPACIACDTEKAARPIEEFLAHDPKAPRRDQGTTQGAVEGLPPSTPRDGPCTNPGGPRTAGRSRVGRADEVQPPPSRYCKDTTRSMPPASARSIGLPDGRYRRSETTPAGRSLQRTVFRTTFACAPSLFGASRNGR